MLAFFIKKPLSAILAAGAFIGIASYAAYIYFGSKQPVYEFISASRGTVIQTVDADGRVKPAENVDLAFERGGKVSRVYADVGMRVAAGQTLANLEDSTLKAQLGQANAALETQQAKFAQLKIGTRPEEIQVKQDELEKAKTDLANSERAAGDALNDGYAKADDAVRVQSAQLFSNNSGSYRLNFSSCDSQAQIDSESLRGNSDYELRAWQTELRGLTPSAGDSDIKREIENSQNHLASLKRFFDRTSYLITNNNCVSNFSSGLAYLAFMNAGENEIISAVNELNGLTQTLDSKTNAVRLASSELRLTLAGATNEEIKGQEAEVEAARSNTELVQAQISQTLIRSPIDGIVTRQDAKIGQIVSPNIPVISVISSSKFEIEAYVSEADVAKVKVGNPADITLDAYGNSVVFEARVAAVDPAETVINGSPAYKITLQFLRDDERIKAGLSANVDITSAEAKNVLVLPRRALITREDKKFVLIGTNKGGLEERQVATGIEGADGNVEIRSGLNEGERVADFGR